MGSTPKAPPAAPVAPAPSFRPTTPMTEKTGDSRDSKKLDSMGEAKTDLGPVGPRGLSAPPDVMTAAERQAVADKQESRLKAGMSSTDNKDSIGNVKEPNPAGPSLIGPRGVGAPADTYHGARPAPKP